MRLQKKSLKIDEATMSQKDFWRSLLRGSQVEAVSDVRAAGSGGLRWSTPISPVLSRNYSSHTPGKPDVPNTENTNPSNNPSCPYHGRLGSLLLLPPALCSAQRRAEPSEDSNLEFVLEYSFNKGSRCDPCPKGCGGDGGVFAAGGL